MLERLVRRSDVLVENFTPRVMRNWGMTYDHLASLNPRLVMLSNTGYGSTGPWAPFRAQGTTLEATMGLSQYTGYADGPPTKVGPVVSRLPRLLDGPARAQRGTYPSRADG